MGKKISINPSEITNQLSSENYPRRSVPKRLVVKCVSNSQSFNLVLINRSRTNELSVKCLLYADDQVIIAPSVCELKELIINMDDSVNKIHMHVTVSEVMVFERGERTTKYDVHRRSHHVKELRGLKEDVVTKIKRGMLPVRGLIQALQSLHRGFSVCLRINAACTDWFVIRKGVRKGCVASPWLLNLFMESCVYDLKEYDCGLRMAEGFVGDLQVLWVACRLTVSQTVFRQRAVLECAIGIEREIRGEFVFHIQKTTNRRGSGREMRVDVIRTRWSAVIGGTLLTRGRLRTKLCRPMRNLCTFHTKTYLRECNKQLKTVLLDKKDKFPRKLTYSSGLSQRVHFLVT
ncbi:hypothetical protein EVAR_62877_1 [Eumeta japonica]|uniref:Reverse transcriptase domain-containing protein n=1 Tax=Eumeta variegata TaxID=151549 RepID=A0A4C1Z380_EUMVA|nr:hypothetical protein EVAR_62877_1 [Eumeta japonica]